MSNATMTIEQLKQRLRELGDAEHVIAGLLALSELKENIPLEDFGNRAELHRIYARRERTAKKSGYVVPGGASLVEGLAGSTAERVFVIYIKTSAWYGIIFLEDSELQKCLGCICGRDTTDGKPS